MTTIDTIIATIVIAILGVLGGLLVVILLSKCVSFFL